MPTLAVRAGIDPELLRAGKPHVPAALVEVLRGDCRALIVASTVNRFAVLGDSNQIHKRSVARYTGSTPYRVEVTRQEAGC